MDWDKLKIFHAVAEAGNFTKATYILKLTQSAISRQIQTLEIELKTKLFERHARGLSLTENGEYLFKTAHEVISKLKDVESTILDQKNKPSGSFTSANDRLSPPISTASPAIVVLGDSSPESNDIARAMNSSHYKEKQCKIKFVKGFSII